MYRTNLSILLLLLPICIFLTRTDGFLSAPTYHRCSRQFLMRTLQRREYLSGDNQQVGGEEDSGRLFSEELNIIFDSKCNVCQFEVDHLQSRIDKFFGGKSLIRFTDLESKEGYDESDPANGGVTYEMGMRSFHAVKPNGEILHGVPVFCEAYEVVDQAWVWEATKIPVIGKLASLGYDAFAKIRTQLTRGSSVDDLIENHYLQKQKFGQDESACIPCQEKEDEVKQ